VGAGVTVPPGGGAAIGGASFFADGIVASADGATPGAGGAAGAGADVGGGAAGGAGAATDGTGASDGGGNAGGAALRSLSSVASGTGSRCHNKVTMPATSSVANAAFHGIRLRPPSALSRRPNRRRHHSTKIDSSRSMSSGRGSIARWAAR